MLRLSSLHWVKLTRAGLLATLLLGTIGLGSLLPTMLTAQVAQAAPAKPSSIETIETTLDSG
jgi:hypothetical protein